MVLSNEVNERDRTAKRIAKWGIRLGYVSRSTNSLYFDHTHCPPLLWRETQKSKLLGATTKNEKLLPSCLFLVLGLFFGSNIPIADSID
jgi:hypothetical protein